MCVSTVKNLLPYRLNALLPFRKAAFTLAEVLITLGIIGVVAAMTMPVIISKIEDKANIARWKKTYSVISNAFLATKAEGLELCATHDTRNYNICSNGNPVNELGLGYWTPEFMRAFISKLKVVKTCGVGLYKFTDYTCLDGVDMYVWQCNWAGCYASLGGEYQEYTRSYAGVRPNITYKGAKNNSTLGYYGIDEQSVLLEDGTVLYFGGWPYGPWVIADVNGWKKGPNMVGKDVFGVQLFENKILPSGAQGSTGYDNSSSGASGCSKDIGLPASNVFSQIAGAGCSYKYLAE